MDAPTFEGSSVVSCGTLRPEVSLLREEGFLDADRVLFTAPGLHEWPGKLEEQLSRRIAEARETSDRVIVLYGQRCFVDFDAPQRDVDALVDEQGGAISRVEAGNCVDMLADESLRQEIAGEDKVYWLTPGWVANWKFIFKDWDAGLANETFPQNKKAVLLDAVGFYQKTIEENPELILEFSDFMKIPLEPHPVSLDRLRDLLSQQLHDHE